MTAVLQYGIPPLCCEDAMSETAAIRSEMPGDWWYYAGMLATLLNYDRERDKTAPTWNGTPQRNGYSFHIWHGTITGHRLADVLFTGLDGMTRVVVATATGSVAEWEDRLKFLHAAADQARTIRHEALGLTPDEAVELFYRQRAAGARTSLRQIAEQYRLNYANLLKHKQRYDRAGKFGAGKKRNSLPDKSGK